MSENWDSTAALSTSNDDKLNLTGLLSPRHTKTVTSVEDGAALVAIFFTLSQLTSWTKESVAAASLYCACAELGIIFSDSTEMEIVQNPHPSGKFQLQLPYHAPYLSRLGVGGA